MWGLPQIGGTNFRLQQRNTAEAGSFVLRFCRGWIRSTLLEYSFSTQPCLQQTNCYQSYLHVQGDLKVAASTTTEMFFRRQPKEKEHNPVASSLTTTHTDAPFLPSGIATTTTPSAPNSNSSGRHLFSTPSIFKRNSNTLPESMSHGIATKTDASHDNPRPTTAALGELVPRLPTLIERSIMPSPAPGPSSSSSSSSSNPYAHDNHLQIPGDVSHDNELVEAFSNMNGNITTNGILSSSSAPQRQSPSPSLSSSSSSSSSLSPSSSASTTHRRTPSPRPPPIVTTPRPRPSTSSPPYFSESHNVAVMPALKSISTSTWTSSSAFNIDSSLPAPVPTHLPAGDLSNILSPLPNTGSIHHQRLIDALSVAFDKITLKPEEEVIRSPRSPHPRTPRTPRTPSSPHSSSPSSPRFLHKRSTSATNLNSQYIAGDRMYQKRNSSGINIASVISAVEQQQQRITATSTIPTAAVASFVTPHVNLSYPRHGLHRYNLPSSSTSSLSSTTSNPTAPASPTIRSTAVDTLATLQHGSIFNIPEDESSSTPAIDTFDMPINHKNPSSPSSPRKLFGSSSTTTHHGHGNVAGKIVKRPVLKMSFPDVHAPLHSKPVSLAIKKATPVTPKEMADMLRSGKETSRGKKRPLLIDVRDLAEYQQSHVGGSFNVNLPTLLIKRYRRGSISNFSLESFITTLEGKEAYLERLRGSGKTVQEGSNMPGLENRQDETMSQAEEVDNEEVIIVYDEKMNESDKSSPAWTLIGVLERAVSGNLGATTEEDSDETTPHTATRVFWLKGGFEDFVQWDKSLEFLSGDMNGKAVSDAAEQLQLQPATPGQLPSNSTTNSNVGSARRTSMFSLDTMTTRPKRDSLVLSKQASLRAAGWSQARPPMRTANDEYPPSLSTTSSLNNIAMPSSFNHNNPPNAPIDHAASTPTSAFGTQINPWGFDSSSATTLSRSSTVSRSSAISRSSAVFSNTGSVSTNTPVSPVQSDPSFKSNTAIAASGSSLLEEQPATPATPVTDCDSPRLSASEETFSVSEIIPGFLFVGPELMTTEHVSALEERRIRRVLNMAEECHDDVPGLKEDFVYKKIAARDTVDMRNVEKCLVEAVEFIDNSKHNHDPIYVHCKAGKSRSVTAVLAYLISIERWTLKRAYRHVTKMRPGICPNIGFVAELMRIEDGIHGVVSSFVGPDSGNEGSMPSPELTREIERLEREWEKDSNGSEEDETEGPYHLTVRWIVWLQFQSFLTTYQPQINPTLETNNHPFAFYL
ncbi:hypothetical protein BC937DRAFT_90061 [Endogone sp. FLAS-F59071]|nr:hypothetical protein BC937DRAFT_90061 [Endogone sp. FLAS-F59071]|eukprot:RUS17374.1 hypothetical protein BC937DRAFT_90061 [Endogone sp. FLAS-F59071]